MRLVTQDVIRNTVWRTDPQAEISWKSEQVEILCAPSKTQKVARALGILNFHVMSLSKERTVVVFFKNS